MGKKHKGLAQALASQQAQLRKEAFSQARQAQQESQASRKGKQKAAPPPPKPVVPFIPGQRILLVGEANFSFALSLVKHHMPEHGPLVFATTYDSRAISAEKYPDLDENVAALIKLGATVLFDVDACHLDKVKQIKGMLFDAVVFNFPHVGAGEKDQDRNVRLNQSLILQFLRSCPPFLVRDSRPANTKKRKRTDEDEEDPTLGLEAEPTGESGYIYITLRNTKPYTLWDVPLLAKKGPVVAPSILPHPLNRLPPSSQPVYKVERSFSFPFASYPGYAHRRTIGFQAGLSTENSEDARLPAKARRKGGDASEAGGEARTWQLALQTT